MKSIAIIALCAVMLGVGMAEVSRTSPTAWAVEPDEPEQSTVLQSTATVRYALTAAERDTVERVVMAEAGAEPHEGQIAVAQCILNACEREDMRPDEIVIEYKYTDMRPNPTDEVKAAVSAVFDYGETVTDIGQKRLFDWLRRNGYLIKDGQSKNMPTQRAMDMGLFEVKESTINNPDGSVRITRTTKVTGKGQTYFVNKFLS